jgi:hypothetical protein
MMQCQGVRDGLFGLRGNGRLYFGQSRIVEGPEVLFRRPRVCLKLLQAHDSCSFVAFLGAHEAQPQDKLRRRGERSSRGQR